MTRWISAALLAAAVLAAPAAEAAKPKPKPISGSYDVTIPVPFAVEGEDGSHCKDAPESLSKNSRKLTLAPAGKLTVRVSGIVGDWVIELYDAKGNRVAYAAAIDPTSTERTLSYKKKSVAKMTYTVMVCNVAGGPKGHVQWTFLPS